MKLLKSKEPAIQREAATALGRLGNPACVPSLLDGLASTSDRFMEQALIFAMIEIDADQPVLAALKSDNPKIQRGALFALDQMEHSDLPQDEVAQLLASDDVALQRAALDVIGRHRGWSKGVVEYVSNQLEKPKMSDDQRELVARPHKCPRRRPRATARRPTARRSSRASAETRLMMLGAVANSRFKRLPSPLRDPLHECLELKDETIARQAIASVARYAHGNFTDQLESIALDKSRPMTVRVEAAVTATAASTGPRERPRLRLHARKLRVHGRRSREPPLYSPSARQRPTDAGPTETNDQDRRRRRAAGASVTPKGV